MGVMNIRVTMSNTARLPDRIRLTMRPTIPATSPA